MKKKNFITYLLIFIFKLVSAQDFEVSPVILSFNAQPGEIQKRTMTVKNHANSKTTFRLELGDYIIDANGKRIPMPRNTNKYSCADWITIDPLTFDILPNESAVVNFNITVPEGNMSTRWCEAYVQTVAEQTSFDADKKLGAGVRLTGRIVVRITQSPEGVSNKAAKIKNLTEVEPSENGDRNFTALVENIGNDIIDCKIFIIAANMKTLEEFDLKPIKKVVYPEGSLLVNLKIPKGKLPKGEYDITAILDYGNKKSLEGTRLKGKFIILE